LVNFSPALAYQVADNFSLGLAFNIYYAMFDLERPAEVATNSYVQYSEESTGLGYGVTLGAHLKVNEMISLGAAIRTKTDVTMSGTAKNSAFAAFNAPESDFDRDVSWPLWIGGGIAVKPIENLTLALDVQYSQWSESEKEFDTKYKNSVWDNNIPADDKKFTLKWEDATQIRFGAEYALNEMATVRAGFYTDPAPAPDETYNVLFPSIDYNAFTGGFSLNFDNIIVEASAEYLMGTDREIPFGKYDDAVPGTHGMNIFAFSIGAGYAFK
jgi:long-chain fatty acid transport protein